MNELIEQIAEVKGSGGDGNVSQADLSVFKDALQRAAGKAEEWARLRSECLRARFNRWGGQSLDGRKWGKNLGYNAEPFEGSSDQRVWWVDEVIQETERLRTVALSRATLRCEPRNGSRDDEQALALTVLLGWLRDRLGESWIEEHRKLTNYELGDSPAVALMRIAWRKDVRLEMRRVTVEELAGLWMQEQGAEGPAAEQAGADFVAALLNPEEGEEELAAMVRRYLPRLTEARARRMVREIRQDGVAEVPVPVVAYAGPEVRAKRFVEDFVVPDNMRDFQRVPVWFEPEWMTKAELLEMQSTDGWDAKWVEDVLKCDGQAAVPEFEVLEEGDVRQLEVEDHRGAYQVVRVWFIAANEDGVPAKYHAMIHMDSERTAYGRRMWTGVGDRWPAVFHRREMLDKWALNSRSVAEIVGPAQFGAKLLRDVAVDNANIGGLPPFVTFGHSNKGNLDLGPLAHLPLRQGGDARFMQPPAFPAAARQVAEDMERDRDNYWCRAGEKVDPGVVAIWREAMAVSWMAAVREEWQIILDLALMNMPADELVRILDEKGARLRTEPQELAGKYDVRLIFDPADLDTEGVVKRCTALRDVLMGLDVDKTIEASRFAAYGVRALFPAVASDGLRLQQEGLQKELEDEAANYAKIRSGAMPTMNTDGAWNYHARLGWYEQLVAANPQVFDDMAADKRSMLAQWMKALEQQAVQHGENVSIGQTGAEGVSGE